MALTWTETMRAGEAALSARDPALARALGQVGPLTWRAAEPGYRELARLVVYQAVSLQAAAAVWRRLEAALERVEVEAVLAARQDDLRACGLSGPKAGHLRAIAEALAGGELQLGAVAQADDEAALAMLTRVRGVGPWTARLYLMVAEGRPDILPDNDLGLLEAYARLHGLERRPTPREFAQIGRAWSPWRSVAAHALWTWLGAQRKKIP